MGGETPSLFTPALDKTILGALEEWHIPGMSIAITSHGRTFSKGYGYSDLESKTSVESDHLFYVASITKHMFSAAFVNFIDSENNEQGSKVTLQTPLADIIREDFVLDTPHTTASITIEDVLSHRSGLARFDMTYGGPLNTPRKITRHLRNLCLSEPTRTKWQYCNIGFVVASHALETLTNTPFAGYMRKTIFDPLGMHHTFATLTDAQQSNDGNDGKHRLATPYAWERGQYVKRQHLDGPEVVGAGALISSVNDWAKWLNALLQKSGPVSESVFKEITKPRMISEIATENDPEPWENIALYCLGLNRYKYRGIEIFSHTGGHCGFTGNMILVPSLKWAVIMFCNSEGAGGDGLVSLGYKLVDDLLCVPKSEQFDCDSILRKRNEEYERRLAGSRDRIYPSIPSPPLLPALPLHAYAGTYTNPAFRTFTFVAQEPVKEDGRPFMLAQPTDRFWPMTLELEHVTGEFWFGRSLSLLRFGFKAEFRLDATGKVCALGMALEGSLGDKLWWFEKEEEKGMVYHDPATALGG